MGNECSSISVFFSPHLLVVNQTDMHSFDFNLIDFGAKKNQIESNHHHTNYIETELS